MKTKLNFTLISFALTAATAFSLTSWAQKTSGPTKASSATPSSPVASSQSKNEEDDIDELAAQYPVSTKLKATRCVGIEESEDKSILIASFDHSRLSFNISSTDKDFQKFKVILTDACQNKKRVDLRYEAESQKIVMLRFSKK